MAPNQHDGTGLGATKLGRFGYIDTLRGLAALLVVWLHASHSFYNLSPATASRSYWLHDFIVSIDIGRIGVVVFFLISGFVIPFSIKPTSSAPIGSFAIRRLFRIFPAYWLSVPLAAFVFYWALGQPFGSRDLLVNLTLLQSFFGVRDAEGVYWTLPVELVFYGLCITLLLLRSLHAPRRIALLCAALMAVHAFGAATFWLGRPALTLEHSFWALNLATMLWGTLYRFQPSNDFIATLIFRGLGITIVAAMPLATTIVGKWPPIYTVSYALGFIVFIIGVRFIRIESHITDWLGRISYSIYLFHPIIYQPMVTWLRELPATSAWRTQHLATYLAATILLTLAVATLIFRFVEEPMIRLGHRLATRYELNAMRGGVLPSAGRSQLLDQCVQQPLPR
jgi:peptidoglycan/LPS O-acetylase OafA/YrhL